MARDPKNMLWMLLITGCAVSVQAEGLSRQDRRLLELIADANRVNRQVVRSFDANYSMSIVRPQPGSDTIENGTGEIISKSGRHAFSGEKLYSKETIKESEEAMHYVFNGTQDHVRTSTPGTQGLVAIGSPGISNIRPGSPGPWSLVDQGLSLRIDRLEESEGTITSVEPVVEEGNEYVRVVLERSDTAPDGTPVPIPVTLWYSVEHGYLPTRMEYQIEDRWVGHARLSGRTTVTQIESREIDGNVVFLPVQVSTERMHGEQMSFSSKYQLDVQSVQINPELPGELFEMPIQPTDQVVNLDLDLELQGPNGQGRQMLGSGDRQFEEVVAGLGRSVEESVRRLTIHLREDVSIVLNYIPQGTFVMGSPETEAGYHTELLATLRKRKLPLRDTTEGPLRQVSIPKGFFLGMYELTVEQYRCFDAGYAMMPHEGLRIDADNHPVVVSWTEAVKFCEWLGSATGLRARLPSEEEWEYACRSGNSTRFFWGDREEDAGKYANVADKSFEDKWPKTIRVINTDDGRAGVAPVGQYKPNAFGLHDMIGNVPEWCEDIFYDNAYARLPTERSTEAYQATEHTCRGGGWQSDLSAARCASRRGANDSRDNYIGFRVLIEDVGVSSDVVYVSTNLTSQLNERRSQPAAAIHNKSVARWTAQPIVWLAAVAGVAVAFLLIRRLGRGSGEAKG